MTIATTIEPTPPITVIDRIDPLYGSNQGIIYRQVADVALLSIVSGHHRILADKRQLHEMRILLKRHPNSGVRYACDDLAIVSQPFHWNPHNALTGFHASKPTNKGSTCMHLPLAIELIIYDDPGITVTLRQLAQKQETRRRIFILRRVVAGSRNARIDYHGDHNCRPVRTASM